MAFSPALIEARARALYEAEYADEPAADPFDETDGWEQQLFRRRAWDSLNAELERGNAGDEK